MRTRALSNLKGSLVGFFRGDPNIGKLKARGLKVGSNFNMLGGCIIDHSHCCLITIGDNVTFAPRVHVLAHDASTKRTLGYTRIALTRIGMMSLWAPPAPSCLALPSGTALLSGREAS